MSAEPFTVVSTETSSESDQDRRGRFAWPKHHCSPRTPVKLHPGFARCSRGVPPCAWPKMQKYVSAAGGCTPAALRASMPTCGPTTPSMPTHIRPTITQFGIRRVCIRCFIGKRARDLRFGGLSSTGTRGAHRERDRQVFAGSLRSSEAAVSGRHAVRRAARYGSQPPARTRAQCGTAGSGPGVRAPRGPSYAAP